MNEEKFLKQMMKWLNETHEDEKLNIEIILNPSEFKENRGN